MSISGESGVVLCTIIARSVFWKLSSSVAKSATASDIKTLWTTLIIDEPCVDRRGGAIDKACEKMGTIANP